MEKITCWGANHVWPNSLSMLEAVRSLRICPERKLEIIGRGSTNGIDLGQFSPSSVEKGQVDHVRETIGYDPSLSYLAVIGRVVKDKGIGELVEAFIRLFESFPRIRLLLIGPLERERAEETLSAETLDLIDRHPGIQHIGWTDEVPAYLHVADLLVHPSHREGFPNVLLQAGAMGCPIVCSAIPGNIDIVTDGSTGLSFPVGDAVALEARIRSALERPDAMRAMAQRLRSIVEDRYDRQVLHQLLLERYEELLLNETVSSS